jgi:hypothetical protein
VKYIAIIYGNKDMWESFPPEVAATAIGQVGAFNQRHAESGELLG